MLPAAEAKQDLSAHREQTGALRERFEQVTLLKATPIAGDWAGEAEA